jgi:hypothetical protein
MRLSLHLSTLGNPPEKFFFDLRSASLSVQPLCHHTTPKESMTLRIRLQEPSAGFMLGPISGCEQSFFDFEGFELNRITRRVIQKEGCLFTNSIWITNMWLEAKIDILRKQFVSE